MCWALKGIEAVVVHPSYRSDGLVGPEVLRQGLDDLNR
jgi:ABC-type ATPase with predicted acetyltransferase domain